MLRGMVFVDHMNFDIALKDYYRACFGTSAPKLDYDTMFRALAGLRNNIDYLKTFIFAPEPDDFLKRDATLLGYYKWTQGLKGSKYLDVVEGRYLARPVDETRPMDITDRNTYYKVEKGTDINLAIHAITKAQTNAYDVAFVMSADTDYISVYRQLKNLGKIVIVVAVKGQNIGKIRAEVDDFIFLDDSFFKNHVRTPMPKTGTGSLRQ